MALGSAVLSNVYEPFCGYDRRLWRLVDVVPFLLAPCAVVCAASRFVTVCAAREQASSGYAGKANCGTSLKQQLANLFNVAR